jgi:alpha-tubulin suppressor-like RCC1 family protein
MSKKHYIILTAIGALLVIGALRIGTLFSGHQQAGNIFGFGYNKQAQLAGTDRTKETNTLTQLTLGDTLKNEKFIDISAGHFTSLMLTQSGKVYAVGSNNSRLVKDTPLVTYDRPNEVSFEGLEAGETITQIDASRDHALALTSHGRVYAWGSNATGQLGDGTNTTNGKPRVVANLPKATKVATGYRHSVAITEDGSVYGWGGKCTDENYSAAQKILEQAGSNITGLGAYGSSEHQETVEDVSECTTQDSTFVQSKKPVKIVGIEGKAVAIAAGFGHLMVKTESGDLYTGGCNTHDQLGRTKPPKGTEGRNNMAKVELPGKVQAISAGYRHSLVTLTDGTLMAWGYNGQGYVLHVDSADPTIKKPIKVKTDKKFNTIEAAYDTSFGVTTDGTLDAWGQDDQHAFWKDNPADIHELAKIPADTPIITAGMEHLLVLERG